MKYHNIFARQRLYFGINTQFEAKLTPKHNDPVYAQDLSTRSNPIDEKLVELDLMQENFVIATLLFSKYFSPNFAQRKPNGSIPSANGPTKDQPPQ